MIMSQCLMIFGAHLDSLTQEPLCVFPPASTITLLCRYHFLLITQAHFYFLLVSKKPSLFFPYLMHHSHPNNLHPIFS